MRIVIARMSLALDPGQRDLSKHNLQEFLKNYHEHDGWTNNAIEVLKRLDDPNAVPMKRPMEPPG